MAWIGRAAVSARLVAGSANRPLAEAIAALMGCDLAPCEITRFPDGELRVSIAELRGEDAYIIQPTGPPVNDHLVELLLLADACRRGGSVRLTAVVPYFGYARQDRRSRAGECVGARVAADALAAAGLDHLIVIDPHTPALEAMCGIGVTILSAVPDLVAGLQAYVGDDTVIVAPDLGAIKLANRYATLLGDRAIAAVGKTRTSGAVVEAGRLIGDVSGRPVVIVDDMITTGATLEAACAVTRAHGATGDIVIAATHGLFVDQASERLRIAGAARILTTDTVPVPDDRVVVSSTAPLLAETIHRLHHQLPLGDLLGR